MASASASASAAETETDYLTSEDFETTTTVKAGNLFTVITIFHLVFASLSQVPVVHLLGFCNKSRDPAKDCTCQEHRVKLTGHKDPPLIVYLSNMFRIPSFISLFHTINTIMAGEDIATFVSSMAKEINTELRKMKSLQPFQIDCYIGFLVKTDYAPDQLARFRNTLRDFVSPNTPTRKYVEDKLMVELIPESFFADSKPASG
jgi:hypothetical protein